MQHSRMRSFGVALKIKRKERLWKEEKAINS